MHGVFGEIFHSHRLKCSGTDMQRQPRQRDAARLQCRQHRLVEMQAGGGGGHRAGRFCVDRLITRGSGGTGLMRDVGRQGHAAGAFDQREDVGAVEKTQFVKFAGAPQHLGRGPAIQQQTHAGARRLAGTHLRQHARAVAIENALDQHLDLSAALLVPGQARVDHTRVVHHQHVAGLDQ